MNTWPRILWILTEQASFYLDKSLVANNQIIINTFYLSQKVNKITNEKSV